MGCCLFAVLGALWPRVILVILWLAQSPTLNSFTGVNRIWPLLGFLLLPTTTLAYALIKYNVGGIDNPWLALLALAFMHDLGTFGGMRRRTVVVQAPARDKFVDPS